MVHIASPRPRRSTDSHSTTASRRHILAAMKTRLIVSSLCILLAEALSRSSLAADVTLEEPKNHGGFFSFAISPDGSLVAGGTGTVTSTFGGRQTVAGGEVIHCRGRLRDVPAVTSHSQESLQ